VCVCVRTTYHIASVTDFHLDHVLKEKVAELEVRSIIYWSDL